MQWQREKRLALPGTKLQPSSLRSVTLLTELSLIMLVKYLGFNFKMKGYFKKKNYILK
jgi:hypothetical protein